MISEIENLQYQKTADSVLLSLFIQWKVQEFSRHLEAVFCFPSEPNIPKVNCSIASSNYDKLIRSDQIPITAYENAIYHMTASLEVI